VPPNTRACVRIPKLGEANPLICEGGVTVWNRGESTTDRPGITEARDEAEAVAFEVGSGDYSFTKDGSQ
ncbi:MAG: hypothetical protein OXC00_12450, partial [Acidimicrobiaceae bacterium]|nr:hypothetical protein [Acidimicrobiaceae bacterium]